MAASDTSIHIVGGGLAGSEAAWQAAEAGARVELHEMRPDRLTEAHKTDALAELVCSNSFRSDDAERNAVGLLHEEMRRCGSLIIRAADAHRVPAGGALAVDREGFSAAVTEAIESHPRIRLARGEVAGLPPAHWPNVVVATGPLTSPALAAALRALTGEEALSFFDAIAPIVHKDSIDRELVWAQSRYDKAGTAGGGADYLNCPMTEADYDRFIDALLAAEAHAYNEFDKTPYFEGCLPIEEMARRGRDTPRFGPMKPVGLTDPRHPERRPHAVVQLRQDNALGTLWNMVGFQTRIKYAQQAEVFRLIPGLGRAEFARLGGMHRNTFLNSPHLLGPDLKLKADPRLRFAGQITGVEGYVESAALGLVAGRMAAAEAQGGSLAPPPPDCALGALIAHVTGGHLVEGSGSFQPMNVNFGLFPAVSVPKPAEGKWRGRQKGEAKKRAISSRALAAVSGWAQGAGETKSVASR